MPLNLKRLPGAVRAKAAELDSELPRILESETWQRGDRQLVADAMQALHQRAEQQKRDLSDAEALLWDIGMSRVKECDESPAIRRGIGREDATPGGTTWRDSRGREVRVYQPCESIAAAQGRDHELEGVSFGAAVRALITGPRNEAERRALAEGTNSAGGFTVPLPLSAQFFDLLRAKSVCATAGMQTVVMESETLRMAKLLTDVPCAWRDENAAVATGDPTFGAVELEARSLAGLITLSRELAADSINIDQMLAEAVAAKFAAEIDRVCLVGSGTAPQPRGIKNQSGVPTAYTGENGGPVTFEHLLNLRETLEMANQSPTAYVMSPRTSRALQTVKDLEGRWVPLPEWAMSNPSLPDAFVPIRDTTAMPITETRGTATNSSSIIAGNFTSLLLGLREQVNIEIVPGAGYANGQVVLVVHCRADCAIVRAGAFAVLSGITPT